jgi:hypothetical protein
VAAFPFAVATAESTGRSAGRTSFWLGIGIAILGMALCVAQLSMKVLIVPWYLPVLGTLGALLLLSSVFRRRSVVRILAFGLIAFLATFEWLFLLSFSRLPAYEGPAQAGQQIPAFETTLADGSPLTDKDFQTGIPTVLVFFRGRW